MVHKSNDNKKVQNLVSQWLNYTYLVSVQGNSRSKRLMLMFALEKSSKMHEGDFILLLESNWHIHERDTVKFRNVKALKSIVGSKVIETKIVDSQLNLEFSGEAARTLVIENSTNSDEGIGWNLVPAKPVIEIQGGSEGEFSIIVQERFSKLIMDNS